MVFLSRIIAFAMLILLSGWLFSCSGSLPPAQQSAVLPQAPVIQGDQDSSACPLTQKCQKEWAYAKDPSEGRSINKRPLTQLSQPPLGVTTCSTWDDDRHILQAARPGWLRYTNDRFGFSVEVPADWYEACPPINGDGLAIDSPDGLAQISFYGFVNVMDGSNPEGLQTLEEYVGDQGQPIVVDGQVGREVIGPTYARSEEDGYGCFKSRWIALLGRFYGRGVRLIAPPQLFDQYNAVLDEMLRTYQIGNVDGQ